MAVRRDHQMYESQSGPALGPLCAQPLLHSGDLHAVRQGENGLAAAAQKEGGETDVGAQRTEKAPFPAVAGALGIFKICHFILLFKRQQYIHII